MRSYLLLDNASIDLYYARKSENQINPELVRGMEVGDFRDIPNSPIVARFLGHDIARFQVQREK